MFSATLLKRPRTPPSTTPTLDYQSADSEHLMKRARPGVQPVDEVKTVSIMIHLSLFIALALLLRLALLAVLFAWIPDLVKVSSCLLTAFFNAFLTLRDGQVNYAGGPSHPQNNASPDDLPKNVARSFNQGSCVMSMDFHPIQQTVLLGTNLHSLGSSGLHGWNC
jgi:hypothetical protein